MQMISTLKTFLNELKMNTHIKQSIIELSGTTDTQTIEYLYKEGMAYMSSHLDYYLDKNYPCSTVFKTLILEGVRTKISNI
jgi:hypothetical protein